MRAAEPEVRENSLAPRANPELAGHEAAERELERLYRAGRLPHAILVTGPRGIGKATLAFRLARFLLAQSEGAGGGLLDGATAETGLAVDPESGIFRRVAAGGHADLFTVERGWDPRRRRLRSEIVVDDAREIAGFFRLTAAEEGWRIVVIDGAEEMNRNAANAVLKILEEPPERALLILVSHNPGRLLATVRSRCRRIALAPLPVPLAAELLRRYRPRLDATAAAALVALSGGSVGRAVEFSDTGGLDLYRELMELLVQPPAIDLAQLHALADRLARADGEDAARASEELLTQLLARVAIGAARGALAAEEVVPGENAVLARLAAFSDPASWAGLRAEIEYGFAAARELNLDRKQTLLGAFFAIAELAR